MRPLPLLFDVQDGRTYALSTLQNEVRSRMKRKGLTQEQVGAALDPPISQAAVSAALRDPETKGAEPRPETLIRILELVTDRAFTGESRRRIEITVHKAA